MRSHRVILRKIGEQKLDPKVPYVVGKNGQLVPSRPGAPDEVSTKREETLPVVTEVVKTSDDVVAASPVKEETKDDSEQEAVVESPLVETSASTVTEEKVEASPVAVSETPVSVEVPVSPPPKKKMPPPKKKKTEAATAE